MHSAVSMVVVMVDWWAGKERWWVVGMVVSRVDR